jgi:hypothetical protein
MKAILHLMAIRDQMIKMINPPTKERKLIKVPRERMEKRR